MNLKNPVKHTVNTPVGLTRACNVALALTLALTFAACGKSADPASHAGEPGTVTAPIAATAPTPAQVELASSDVVLAKIIELTQGLAISGTLKAVNSAVVKARVAGELQALTLREGDSVQAGQVVARVDATEYLSRVRQATEQADAARAQIDIAQRQFDNNKALVNQGFISKTALDSSGSTLLAAQANHKAALAAADVAKKTVDDTVLRAPIAGMVSQRLAQPGERVGVDARVLEILDLSRLELEAALSPADSMQVQVGQLAQLQIEGAGAPVQARVARINPSAQAGNRSVLAYLSVSATTGLRHGLFAQGTLGTGRVKALAVPVSAVRTDRPAPYVQAVQNNLVVHVPVELGLRGESQGAPASSTAVAGESMVAVKGLAEGAMVLRGAVGSLLTGTRVKFTAVPATPPTLAASRANGA